jgi:hypothetical protein
MIVHLVCFRYKPEVDSQAKHNHRERLRGLKDLDEVLDLKVGEDVVRSARSYDTGMLVFFKDRAALAAYANHPQHVPIAQLGLELSASIVSADFEA